MNGVERGALRARVAGVALVLGLMLIPLHAAEIEGIKLADKARLGDAGSELVLNGAGVRTRLFFKVYVGSLYLQQKKTAVDAVLADAGAKRIAMHLVRELTSEQLFSALNDGLNNNHTPEQLARLEPQVKQLESIFSAIKSAKPGDVILIDYLPGTGTRITVNRGRGLQPRAAQDLARRAAGRREPEESDAGRLRSASDDISRKRTPMECKETGFAGIFAYGKCVAHARINCRYRDPGRRTVADALCGHRSEVVALHEVLYRSA